MKKFINTIVLFLIVFMVFPETGRNVGDTPKNSPNPKTVYFQLNINQPGLENCYSGAFINENNGMEKWVNILPNPNTGIFNVEIGQLKTGQNISIDIYTMSRQNVHSFSTVANAEDEVIALNLDELPKGVYFIRISVENKMVIQKLIIL